MTIEVVVKKKGQVTIPAKIRKKLAIEECFKLEVTAEKETIMMKKLPHL